MNCDYPKQKLDVEGQIRKLEKDGISFRLCSREKAAQFLTCNTYLFKIKSYLKNYPRDDRDGLYHHVDFAYLVELSTLDMHFRNLVLRLCLSIEHQLKVTLMRDFTQNPLEDGYSIIQDFFEQFPAVRNELEHRRVFESEKLMEKYFPDVPIWVFLEVCTFGGFTRLLTFYYRKYPTSRSESLLRLVYSVRFLRNACAHNNCLLNSLREPYTRSRPFRPNRDLMLFLQKKGFSRNALMKKMTNPLVHDFTASLRLFSLTCQSRELYQAVLEDFRSLFSGRFLRHADYFSTYPFLTSYYEFAVKVIDLFSKEDYLVCTEQKEYFF